MYQGNKLRLLPPPVVGASSKKRVRETVFAPSAPAYHLLPPNDRLPNNFPPPPAVPHTPTVRLGFNAYEQQQMLQKRVCLNSAPSNSYGNMLCNQQDNYMLQEPLNYIHQPNYLHANDSNMQYTPHNQVQNYSGILQAGNGSTCSSYLYNTSHPYTYTHMKENTNPNIPFPHLTHPHNTHPDTSESPPKPDPRENKGHQLSRGLQLITVSPDVIHRWVPMLDSFNIIFEVFALCTQIPEPFSMNGEPAKEFLAKIFYLKNPHAKESSRLKCVYWEVENQLLPMQLDKVYRVIGSYDVKNLFVKVFDARAAKMDEVANWPVLVARSNRLIRKLPLTHNEI